MSELSANVKELLGTAIQAWADERFPDRPNILRYMVFTSVEQEWLKKQDEIEARFSLDTEPAREEAIHG